MDKSSKSCDKCGDVWPNTDRFFQRYQGDPNKLSASCKPCFNKVTPEYRTLWKLRAACPEEEWVCLHCRERKPFTAEYFTPDSRCRNGLNGTCRVCWKSRKKRHEKENAAAIRAYRERYCAENIEKRRESWRAYYEAHAEELKRNARQYYHENAEQCREASRRWREANAERVKESKRSQRAENPEKHREHAHNRRIREREAVGSHTRAQFAALCEAYDDQCLCCGRKATLTRDHVIPLSKGGTDYIGNIQPLCLSCNSSKGAEIVDYRSQAGRTY